MIVRLLCALLLALPLCAQAQLRWPSRQTQACFAAGELDSLLREAAVLAAADNLVPERIARGRYPRYAKQLARAVAQVFPAQIRRAETRLADSLRRLEPAAACARLRKACIETLNQTVARQIPRTPGLSVFLNFDPSDRITWFSARVDLQPDGWLEVTEVIEIFKGEGRSNRRYLASGSWTEAPPENSEIQRGIIRAFPTTYRDSLELLNKTPFSIQSVTRNGLPESWHRERRENGILLYLGKAEVLLPWGLHRYEIRYRTRWQTGFFGAYDQLNWNVTGNGWTFRIDSAAYELRLPPGTELSGFRCFTGPQGSLASDCQALPGDSLHTVRFRTLRPLGVQEGFTASANFPKGAIRPPSAWERRLRLLLDNLWLSLSALLAGILALTDFTLWLIVGRDPRKGTIIPRFEPPPDLSPAALGYVYVQRWHDRLATAALIDAAVHGRIRLDVTRTGGLIRQTSYRIAKGPGRSRHPIPVYRHFFTEAFRLADTVLARGSYSPQAEAFRNAVREETEQQYRVDTAKSSNQRYGLFRLNRQAVHAGTALLAGAAVCAFVYFSENESERILPWALGWLGTALLIHLAFSRVMKAYTPRGREVADEIEGFRMYLSTAEQHRFDAMNPPERTIELYERYLPFAIALGVEHAWGKQFEAVFRQAAAGAAAGGSSWHNLDYRSFSSDASRSFSSSIGSSFTGAISSSSTPPGSSDSGGSSSGGSGGGGGGGGGSGW
ncbi:MAG: DUF2207 domain-containing protein [Bacteroidia bacterium]|nr:DUF2207 domain-containing protein [Bacteroidia bacterium]